MRKNSLIVLGVGPNQVPLILTSQEKGYVVIGIEAINIRNAQLLTRKISDESR